MCAVFSEHLGFYCNVMGFICIFLTPMKLMYEGRCTLKTAGVAHLNSHSMSRLIDPWNSCTARRREFTLPSCSLSHTWHIHDTYTHSNNEENKINLVTKEMFILLASYSTDFLFYSVLTKGRWVTGLVLLHITISWGHKPPLWPLALFLFFIMQSHSSDKWSHMSN